MRIAISSPSGRESCGRQERRAGAGELRDRRELVCRCAPSRRSGAVSGKPTRGFEPRTPALPWRCSGLLSYVGVARSSYLRRAERGPGELFLELENCTTLGLVLCPARTIAKLGLRMVIPASSAI